MKKERLLYLDITRAVAVVCVFVCHYTRSLESSGVGFSNKILPDYPFHVYLGSLGVSLFFIISGASLMYVYSENCKLTTYLKKRFWSIYPMFWIAYLSAFLINFWNNRGVDYIYPKSRYLLSILGMDGYFSWYGGTYYILGEWFLGCLIFLYLLFPLLLIGVKKYPLATAALSLAVYFICAFFLKTKMPVELWFFVRVPELMMGMFIVKYSKKPTLLMVIPSCIILVLAAVFDILWIPPVFTTPVVGICFFFVLYYISQFLNFEVIRRFCGVIGKYSYAVFLSHHFLLLVMLPHYNGVILKRSENYFLFAVCVIIVGFASWLLQLVNQAVTRPVQSFIEEKCTQFVKKRA